MLREGGQQGGKKGGEEGRRIDEKGGREKGKRTWRRKQGKQVPTFRDSIFLSISAARPHEDEAYGSCFDFGLFSLSKIGKHNQNPKLVAF